MAMLLQATVARKEIVPVHAAEAGEKMNALGPYLPDVAGRRLPQAERLAHAQSRSVKKNQHEQRVLLIIVIYLKIKV